MTRFRSALLVLTLAAAGCGDNKAQMPKDISPQPTGNPGKLMGGPDEPGRGKVVLTK